MILFWVIFGSKVRDGWTWPVPKVHGKGQNSSFSEDFGPFPLDLGAGQIHPSRTFESKMAQKRVIFGSDFGRFLGKSAKKGQNMPLKFDQKWKITYVLFWVIFATQNLKTTFLSEMWFLTSKIALRSGTLFSDFGASKRSETTHRLFSISGRF